MLSLLGGVIYAAMCVLVGWLFGDLRGWDRGFREGDRNGLTTGKIRAIRAISKRCETFGVLDSHVESTLRHAIDEAWKEAP